jgi:hypothetical protein
MKTNLYDKTAHAPATGPERYYRVSQTQLSIARHYGGANINSTYYVYLPDTDELVRHDIWAAEQKEAKRLALERKKWEALLKAESDEALKSLQQELL